MKLLCSAKQLSDALATVMGAIPTKPNHPILANVLLKASGKTVEVKAFDLSLGITARLEATVEQEGAFTLPAKHLFTIVSSLKSEEELSFAIELDKQEATLTSAGKRYKFRGMPASDFPELPTIEPSTGQFVTLNASILSRGLKGTLFATANDETKQVLTGVRLTVEGESVEFAATNSKVLAVVKDAVNTNGDKPEFNSDNKRKGKRKSSVSPSSNLAITVPGYALKELQKLLGNPTESKDDFQVRLHFNDSQIVFTGSNFSLVCRALAGKYPDYSQLIPSDWRRELHASKQQLLAAVSRLATFDKHKIIRLVINHADQVLSLYVEGKDIGSGSESIPALINGDDLQIGFDADVLIPAIKAISTSELLLKFNRSNAPATINAVASPLSTATVLVMPVELCSETTISSSSIPASSEESTIQTNLEPVASLVEEEIEDEELKLATLPM